MRKSSWFPLSMPTIGPWLRATDAADLSGVDNPKARARREAVAVLEMSGALPSEIAETHNS